jgi:hypothetical protein
VRLTKPHLQQLKLVLSRHHSKDFQFLRRITAEMTYDPWQCGHCRKVAKATANNCSHCGASWEDANPNFTPPVRGKSQKHQQAQWEDNSWGFSSYGNPKSPRSSRHDPSWNQRPKSPRKGRHKHGGYKGKHSQTNQSAHGKGKHQESEPLGLEGYSSTPSTSKGLPPEPPWRPALPSMPSLPPLPPPAAPHPDSQAAQTLTKLTAAIKKNPDQYDAEVHAILQGATMVEGLNAKEQMLKAAEDLGTAREAIDAARLGRYQNHVRWRDFLTSAASRWQEYTADFQQQERGFSEAIENAKAVMANARERFESSKAALSADDQAAFGEVADVSMAEKSHDNVSGQALQANLETMAANL